MSLSPFSETGRAVEELRQQIQSIRSALLEKAASWNLNNLVDRVGDIEPQLRTVIDATVNEGDRVTAVMDRVYALEVEIKKTGEVLRVIAERVDKLWNERNLGEKINGK